MAININNYNDVFGKLTKAVDIASASDNEEINLKSATALIR